MSAGNAFFLPVNLQDRTTGSQQGNFVCCLTLAEPIRIYPLSEPADLTYQFLLTFRAAKAFNMSHLQKTFERLDL